MKIGDRRIRAGAIPAVLVVTVVFGAALAGAVRSSLRPDPFAGGSTLDAWRDVLADPAFLSAAWFSIWTALLATGLAVALALPIAIAIRRTGRGHATMALPVAIPHLLMATLVVLWLGPGGFVDRLVGTLAVVRHPSGVGIVLVYVLKETPFLVLLALAAWGRRVDQLEEVAAVHGASAGDRLVHVLIPALRVPLVAGSLVVAAFILGSFEVPLVVGPSGTDTLATYALRVTRSADVAGRAHASVALLVATAGALVLAMATARAVRSRHV